MMKVHLEGMNKFSCNLKANNAKLKTFILIKIRHKWYLKSEAEFPVKGSKTSSQDSSKLRVEVFQ